MKNTLIIIGFVLCVFASFGLMQLSKSFVKNYGEWAPNGEHVKHIEETAQKVIDKCKLDHLQGRLKTFKEATECANPAVRGAFEKEGFPHMDKVDDFLALRVTNATKIDKGEITEDEAQSLNGDALLAALETAKPVEAKK